MTSNAFGGNDVHALQSLTGSHTFATSPYVYRLVRLEKDDCITDKDLGSRTILVQQAEPHARLLLPEHNLSLTGGDSVQLEGHSNVDLVAEGGALTLLIAGTEKAWNTPSVTLTHAGSQYTVTKPWGHEIWYSGQHPGYSLKQVFLKAGNRTSLQYHRLKRETNILFDGKINLVFKADQNVPNDNATDANLGKETLGPVTSIDVTPNILHRIEAITDSLLYETSTPHLDDVVRVQDDRNRGHGRIQGEHKA